MRLLLLAVIAIASAKADPFYCSFERVVKRKRTGMFNMAPVVTGVTTGTFTLTPPPNSVCGNVTFEWWKADDGSGSPRCIALNHQIHRLYLARGFMSNGEFSVRAVTESDSGIYFLVTKRGSRRRVHAYRVEVHIGKGTTAMIGYKCTMAPWRIFYQCPKALTEPGVITWVHVSSNTTLATQINGTVVYTNEEPYVDRVEMCQTQLNIFNTKLSDMGEYRLTVQTASALVEYTARLEVYSRIIDTWGTSNSSVDLIIPNGFDIMPRTWMQMSAMDSKVIAEQSERWNSFLPHVRFYNAPYTTLTLLSLTDAGLYILDLDSAETPPLLYQVQVCDTKYHNDVEMAAIRCFSPAYFGM